MQREIFIIDRDFSVVKKRVKVRKESNSNLALSVIALDYMNIGWYIIIPILFFLGVGLLVRKYLVKSDIIVVAFLFIGVVSSFYNVLRLIEWKR